MIEILIRFPSILQKIVLNKTFFMEALLYKILCLDIFYGTLTVIITDSFLNANSVN